MSDAHVDAFIAVGSNIEPARNVPAALDLLLQEVRVKAVSTMYRAAPVDRPGQPPFVNGVWRIETDRTARDLKYAVLREIDELAFIACMRAYPGRNFVTRAVQNAEFTAPAHLGDMLEFRFHVGQTGRTSVRVHVEMVVHDGRGGPPVQSFDGTVVMVCVDSHGVPAPLHA